MAAWLLAVGHDHASWPDALLAIRVYAIAILSFLGGIRWGASLSQDGARRDLLASVAPSLAGWATMFMPPVTALAVLAAAFAAQGAWDVLSAQNGSLPLWFGHMRRRMTFLVVAALLAALYAAG